MKFYITFINNQNGILFDDSISLPVNDDITWDDFINLKQVQELTSQYTNCEVVDITPDGMKDRFSEDDIIQSSLRNQGIKKGGLTKNGMTEYHTVEEEE